MSSMSFEDDRVTMIDVGDKDSTDRVAIAQGKILMNYETLEAILNGQIEKGNVLSVAKTAGILAAKKTSSLLPLCHLLPLESTNINIEPAPEKNGLVVNSRVTYRGKTGVEMEALTSCAVVLLTIYDMVKGRQRDMIIKDVKLLEKSGGKSGDWSRDE